MEPHEPCADPLGRGSCPLATSARSSRGGGGTPSDCSRSDDVEGDDDGNGALIYPNRDDMEPGDLDLVRVSAEQRSDGVWFVVEMAQAIRSPVGRVTELGQTPDRAPRAQRLLHLQRRHLRRHRPHRGRGRDRCACPGAASRWTATSPGRRRSC
ncbi:MAG: hypothetical protein MZV49_12630 [Rhodopseudomonas palustris]|nr:hypothetical protein [Rhodopseudomonas palustris]